MDELCWCLPIEARSGPFLACEQTGWEGGGRGDDSDIVGEGAGGGGRGVGRGVGEGGERCRRKGGPFKSWLLRPDMLWRLVKGLGHG